MKTAIDLSPVQPGEVVAGRYRVERAIGIGGMAVVVAATHLQLEQLVAIKFLLPHVLMEPEIVKRFEREARHAVRIRSEHVAQVFDVGTLDSGAPFMVMEYLDGQDLSSVLRRERRVTVEHAVDYTLQACEALAVAHSLGIVHRDLKPANLFLVENHGAKSIKVLDFGISKTSGLGVSGAGGMTQSAALLGSPSYMSPEQMDSARDVDGLTDIWAIGVTLYELLAGRPPFEASSLPMLCIEIMQKAPPPLRSFAPDVPAGLEAVVLRCLEKDKSRRFQSVAELATALSEFAPRRSFLSIERIGALAARSAVVATSAAAVTPPSTEGRVETVALESVPGAVQAVTGPGATGPGSTSQSNLPSSRQGEGTVAVDGVPLFDLAPEKQTASGATAFGRTTSHRPRKAPRWVPFGGVGAAVALGTALWLALRSSDTGNEQPVASSSVRAAVTEAPAVTAPPEPKAVTPPEPAPPAAPPATASAAPSIDPALDELTTRDAGAPTPAAAPKPVRPRAAPVSPPAPRPRKKAPAADTWEDTR